MRKIQNNTKADKGITLIILVLTIIILLVLATATIKILVEQGVVGVAKDAAGNFIDARDDEYEKLGFDMKDPVIEDIPSTIIVNSLNGKKDIVTELKDSYVKYGIKGGQTTYIVFDQTYEDQTFKEIIENAVRDGKYGKYDVQVIAKASNGKEINKTFNIEIVVKSVARVKNEAELRAAIYPEAEYSPIEELEIILDDDITITDTLLINQDKIQKCKLDLNNHTLSYRKSTEGLKLLEIGEKVECTIFDSSEEKNGTIISEFINETAPSDGRKRENFSTCIVNHGILNFESGKIVTNLKELLVGANSTTNMQDSVNGVVNATTGTFNFNGGTIEAKSDIRGCTYLTIGDAWTISYGIYNEGTLNLNSGNIITDAIAYMIKRTAVMNGRTYAYSYGVYDKGTVNKKDTTFRIDAYADGAGTTENKIDKAEIKR